jgi:hypothetical protein
MTREEVLAKIPDIGITYYHTGDTEKALEELAQRVMGKHGDRYSAHQQIRVMLKDGSLIMHTDGGRVKIEKGSA